MGILDDAIKEHLELKRQHGAGESELKQLEDEAFGAAERPEAPSADALAEAPTQFMSQPEVAEDSDKRSRRPDIADLQEAPPPPPTESAIEPEAPVEEESPAMEHEISTGPTTEEREAIAEQPTEMYDVEEELSSSQTEAPSEEDLVEEEMDEPRLGPVDPLAGAEDVEESEDEEYEEDDDFWDEKRLSDELDQALEAPAEAEEEATATELEEDAAVEGELEAEVEYEEEPAAEEKSSAPPEEDVLEETPDFLEETPEDDQLWFEQKPPKDFDFDD